ncbi:MAG: nucleotidyltransferase domain-containing protein [Anaerolineaceae bacterium]|nr:MAG: nucleotidyltransferase domain-containing protein [Anaerolineaceae bacterium]
MFPTVYPNVNAILIRLLHEAQTLIGDSFLGMYLYGSLAAGDFDPQTSDIDFLIVTTSELEDETFRALQAVHDRLATADARWGPELEGSYIPVNALRRYDTAYNPARNHCFQTGRCPLGERDFA